MLSPCWCFSPPQNQSHSFKHKTATSLVVFGGVAYISNWHGKTVDKTNSITLTWLKKYNKPTRHDFLIVISPHSWSLSQDDRIIYQSQQHKKGVCELLHSLNGGMRADWDCSFCFKGSRVEFEKAALTCCKAGCQGSRPGLKGIEGSGHRGSFLDSSSDRRLSSTDIQREYFNKYLLLPNNKIN